MGIAIVVGYVGLFLALRSRIHEGDRWAMVFLGATVLWAAGLTAVSPELAVSQFVAFPMVWVLAGPTRNALLGSLVLAVAVGVGFWISFGGRVEALPQILLTQMLSLGFAVVMGLWISHIAELGQQKSRLLDELTAAQDELAALHRDAGVTAERARMSREVHDTVAQSLTGLVLLGQRARRAYAAGTLDDDTLELIETGARDALAETRALVAAAAPVELAPGASRPRSSGWPSASNGRPASGCRRPSTCRIRCRATPRWCCCAARRRVSRTCASTPRPRRPG